MIRCPTRKRLGLILYLLFTADLPTTRSTVIATYADDTAVLASHSDATIASQNLQQNLNKIQQWLTRWRMRANEKKSVHVTSLRRETCPPVTLNGHQLPQGQEVKYLGLYIDRGLTWRKHISTKRKQLGLKLREMYWMLSRKSKLSLDNKLLLNKSILKPVWTYGAQLWGTASSSNLEVLQRFQNRVLRIITADPCGTCQTSTYTKIYT